MVAMMRLFVKPAAFAAFDHDAMGVAVGDIDEKLRLACAATIGLITAALAQGRASDMGRNRSAARVGRVDQDHVELRHDQYRYWSDLNGPLKGTPM